MKIMMKSKKHQEESEQKHEWQPVGEEICYWRTDIQRSGWRVPGPINLDDEEDDDQILDDLNEIEGIDGINASNQKKAK